MLESVTNNPNTGNAIFQITAADLEAFALDLIQKVRKEDEDRRIKEQTPPTLWTRAEAAAYLNVSLQSFHAFVRRGDLDIVKVGRRTLVNADQLKAKVEAGDIRKYRHR